MKADDVARLDEMLTEPFDHELTEFQRRRREAKRMAAQTGALQGQAGLLGVMRGGVRRA